MDTFNHLYSKRHRKVHKWSDKLPQYDEYVRVLTKTQGVAVNLKRAFEEPQANPYLWQTQLLIESILKQLNDANKGCKECSCVIDEVGKGKTTCKTVSCNI